MILERWVCQQSDQKIFAIFCFFFVKNVTNVTEKNFLMHNNKHTPL